MRDFEINDSVFVRQSYDRDGCVRVDTAFIVVQVDTAFHIVYEIESIEALYCEGDTGKFFVDIKASVKDDQGNPFVNSNGVAGSDPYHRPNYAEYTWAYNGDVTKEENELITKTEIDPNTGLPVTNNYYQTTFNSNADDTLLFNSYTADTTWSTTFGPFAMEDSIFFVGEPKFCVYNNAVYQSKLKDTLPLKDLLQEKPEIRMAIEGDEDVHVIEDVISIPQIQIKDLNNPNGNLTYQYAISWVDKDGGVKIEGIESFAPAVFGNTVATPPSNYDEVTYVMALEAGACIVYDTTLVVMNFGIFPPTVFTPNGDGEYDEWVIQNIEKYEGASVQVFNRWGSILFESTDYVNNQWNGTYKGEVLPVASYYFVIDLKDGSDVISGAVSIIR